MLKRLKSNTRVPKKALILAGGIGTRLRPLTFAIPKPLIPVREAPIINYILGQLVKYKYKNIYVSVNYRSDLIKLYLGDGEKYKLKINYFDEDIPLGTAGPLSFFKKKNIAIQSDEPVLIINGDILTDLNFQKLASFHHACRADITVGLINFRNQVSYGVLETDEDNNIKSIIEKPTFSYKVSAGIYLVSGRSISLVPDRFFTMPDLIQAALKQKLSVKGYLLDSHWIAIEQIRNLEDINAQSEDDWISRLKYEK
jgi:NDP-sugar pyrophosphorylase family protein